MAEFIQADGYGLKWGTGPLDPKIDEAAGVVYCRRQNDSWYIPFTCGTLSVYGNMKSLGSPYPDADNTRFLGWAGSAWVYSAMYLLKLQAAAAPATPVEGDFYYDSAAKKLKVYNGTAWETVTSA